MKEELKKLISQNKTKLVLDKMLDLSRNSTDLNQEVLLLSSRFADYEKNSRLGITSAEEQRISLAQINVALIAIIDDLPETKKRFATAISSINKTAETHSGPKWWTWIGGFAVIIGILAGIAQFTGYNIKNIFGNSSVDSFSLTVLVHGKNGRDHRILENQGKVVLDIGTDRKEEAINGKGEATFKELPIGFAGKKAFVSIDHDQPYHPIKRNEEYVLEKDKAIYLEVALSGIHKIEGRVLDFETDKPLDSVRVSYKKNETLSDQYGWYELKIPQEDQAKFIRVNFYKEKYEMEDLDSVAPHTQQEIGKKLKRQKQ